MADWTLRESKIAKVRRAILQTRSMVREVQFDPATSVEDLRLVIEQGAALETDVAELVDMLESAPSAQVTDIWAIRRSALLLVEEIQALHRANRPMPEMPYDVQSASKSLAPKGNPDPQNATLGIAAPKNSTSGGLCHKPVE